MATHEEAKPPLPPQEKENKPNPVNLEPLAPPVNLAQQQQLHLLHQQQQLLHQQMQGALVPIIPRHPMLYSQPPNGMRFPLPPHTMAMFANPAIPHAVSNACKSRVRWTSELHARFVDEVNALGGPDHATPKAILRAMGVDGMTILHIKSHLQKYRLQLASAHPGGSTWPLDGGESAQAQTSG
eukprot:CAMPEP_0198213564 /NCGR_PEP_ID=MMETSP1445-20131203/28939_1 /TAXON_ID=36898 /ORGANISM="Pyramimonas sp., Strain CCMP2087" /LENGTH=182 /DNA_ID=CAMNT_0043888223 /DNA_START=198 /DNA_END=742 /DNA_ORIENTATION=+